jgi:hypothetical protein
MLNAVFGSKETVAEFSFLDDFLTEIFPEHKDATVS